MAATPAEQRAFFQKYWYTARVLSEPKEIFPSIVLAQSALESQYGKASGVTTEGKAANTFFGDQVISHCPTRKGVVATTQYGKAQPGEFCLYDDYADSLRGWLGLVESEPSWRHVWNARKQYEKFIVELVHQYNATGAPPKPVDTMTVEEKRQWNGVGKYAAYVQLMHDVISQNGLKAYDPPASSKTMSPIAGKVAAALAQVPPGYTECLQLLSGGWLKYQLNNDLPALTSNGSVRSILNAMDNPANRNAAALLIDGANLNRTLVMLRASQIKSSSPLAQLTLDNLKAACKSDEVNFLTTYMVEDQRKDITDFLRLGPVKM
jgi:hypothetical protein